MSDTDAIDIATLSDSFRDVFETECSLEVIHRLYDGDNSSLGQLQHHAAELGWYAIAVPEQFGGLGLGYPELMALYREAGRALSPLPLLPTSLAADALVRSNNASLQEAWLPLIAGGDAGFTLALPAETMKLRIEGDQAVINGSAHHVLFGGENSHLIVFAGDDSGVVRGILIESGNKKVRIEENPCWDPTRRLVAIHIDQLELPAGQVLNRENDAGTVASLLRHAALAIASDAIGGARHIFDITVDYLKTRVQFGRQIGSFQALKHRCADLKIAIQSNTSLLDKVISLVAQGDKTAPSLVALAKFYACDSYAKTAGDSVQLHGGIGFTREQHCHLFLKRAKLNQFLFGDSAHHKDLACELLLETLTCQ